MSSFVKKFLDETTEIITKIDQSAILEAVKILRKTRDRDGRLFILGVGGSAASASHAVNDFRKLANFEAYAPTDNVSELTARTNDEGWDTVFANWLEGSRLHDKDCLLVLSVGGGDLERNVSPNLVKALELAQKRDAAIVGIVGRDGGYTAKVADAAIIIPTIDPSHITPQTEAMHGVVWHLMVTHPELKAMPTKWESTK